MHTRDKLEITEVVLASKGIYVFAKYPRWTYAYNFFIAEGKVQGEISFGEWLQISNELVNSVQAKLNSTLINKLDRMY